MFKKNAIITPNGLGKRFALDSNLTRIEFYVAGKAMVFTKKAGKYVISFEGNKTVTLKAFPRSSSVCTSHLSLQF